MIFRMVWKSWQIFLTFCHDSRVWQTDRRTDSFHVARATAELLWECPAAAPDSLLYESNQHHLVLQLMVLASRLRDLWTVERHWYMSDVRYLQTPTSRQPTPQRLSWDDAPGAGCWELYQCTRCVAAPVNHLRGRRTPPGTVGTSSTDLPYSQL